MKHRILFCIACLGMLMSMSSWADNSKMPRRMLKDCFLGSDLHQATLKGGIIYFVDSLESLSFSNSLYSPIEISGAGENPAVIYLKKGAKLKVESSAIGLPGIHLPEGQKLVIIGDRGSELIAIGGPAEVGEKGEDGHRGEVHECDPSKNSRSGKGGRGGYGGRGGAPGIGGKSTERAPGGNGSDCAVAHSNTAVSAEQASCFGSDGKAGRAGETMGTLYIIGAVKITATKGAGVTDAVAQAQANGNEFSKSGWRQACASSGGGGGAGGNGGQAIYDIGGAGCSGGGGGGGGAGTLDGDNIVFRSNTLQYARGQGGGGGINGDGNGSQINGLPLERESFDYMDPENDRHYGLGGKGGEGGSTVTHSGNGNIFKSATMSFAQGVTTNPDGTDDLEISKSPIKAKVYFVSKTMGWTIHPEDYDFYFGLPMADNLGASKPVAENPNVKFRGLYLDGKEKQQVYDADGKLNPDYADLLYTLDDVHLVALWGGQTTVRRNLMLQKAEDPNDYICAAYDYKTYDLTEPSMSIIVKDFPQDMIPEGFVPLVGDYAIEIKAGENVTVNFPYDRRENQVFFVNDRQDVISIYRDNHRPRPMHDFSRFLRFGQFINEPMVNYKNAEDANGYERIWSGNWINNLMPMHRIETRLSVRPKKFAVFAQTVEHGHVLDCTIDKPDSITYKESHSWTIQADTGYSITDVKAYRFNKMSNEVMDSVVLKMDRDKKTKTVTIQSMPASDVLLVPSFRKDIYRLRADYYYSSGKKVPYSDIESRFKVNASKNPSSPAIAPEEVKYSYQDVLTMFAQMTSSPENYIIEPEVHDVFGDSIEVTPCLINPETMDAANLYANDEVDAQGNSVTSITTDPAVMGYIFPAPADHCDVKFTVRERVHGTCYFYNETNSVIDSAYVNLEKKVGTLQSRESSSADVLEQDLVGFLASLSDSSLVKAGYHDKNNEYHPLTVYKAPIYGPSGRIVTCFYFTEAPQADNMTMGLATDRLCVSEFRDNGNILTYNNGNRVDVDLVRNYKLQPDVYNSICLPFPLDKNQIETAFGTGTTIGEFTSMQMVNDNLCRLNFSETDNMEAGVPYLINPTKAVDDTIKIDNVLIDSQAKEVKQDRATFIGRFDWTEFTGGDKTILFPLNNKLYYPSPVCKPMRSLRSYFKLNDGLSCETTNFVLAVEGANGETKEYLFGNDDIDFGEEETGMDTTALEQIAGNKSGGIRKVMYKGSLYILVNGQVYDARGNRIN